MVEMEQRDEDGKNQVNNRLITTPAWNEPLRELDEARDLPKEIREQLERFFVAVTAFTDKKVKVHGWGSRRKALRFLEQHIVRGR